MFLILKATPSPVQSELSGMTSKSATKSSSDLVNVTFTAFSKLPVNPVSTANKSTAALKLATIVLTSSIVLASVKSAVYWSAKSQYLSSSALRNIIGSF